MLPRRRPGSRTPLWLQRQRSANLLAVASRYGSFPIILETYRECLRDVFDLPGLIEILSQVRSREIRTVTVETQEASPFARSLLFDYVAAYMYEGDAPLAERRAQALTLDRNLLRDLLGQDELRELLDPDALTLVELELQCLVEQRKARNEDQLHDLLRRVGDLTLAELEVRVSEPLRAGEWLRLLESSHRACPVRIGREERWIPIEDAGRYRDALGVATPQGVPEAFLKPTEASLEGLAGRFARTHSPFVAAAIADRWSIPESLVREALQALEAGGTVVHGDFRPGGVEREWCDAEVLRMLRRRSLARLRREVEAVDGTAFARFSLKWQGIESSASGIERLREVVTQLEGLALPASVLERDILPARVSGYQPRLLDELCASGETAWVGRGRLGKDDGRLALVPRELLSDFAGAQPVGDMDELQRAVLQLLQQRGALFFTEMVASTMKPARDVLDALWELAWAGAVTNDTFAPVRALAWPKRSGAPPRPRAGGLPLEASGRWSATALGSSPNASSTLRAHRLATTLLERYGVVTRETVMAEGVPGGFSTVYPVFKAMEDGGRIRRGYFVEGLGAAQFALPGAVERLRAERDRPEEPRSAVLAATDPANPYGASIPWPKRDDEQRRQLQRTAGATVVLVDGEPVLYLDRGGRGVTTLPAFDDAPTGDLALRALLALTDRAGGRGLTVERIDGLQAAESPAAATFLAAGFAAGYRGLTYRPAMRGVPVAGGR